MAIQTRRGLEEDFDPSKLLPGEWAVSLDTKYVRMCFSPGLVYRMATYESFEEDMVQIQQILATCEDIQTAVEAFEALAEQHANDAAASATASANSATAASGSALLSESWAVGGTGVRPGEDTDNAEYWAGVAQAAADVQIMTPTQIGIGKPDNITIGVSNGTFSTKFKNYTSLSDIGLTAPKTCLEIATAMANNSRITIPGNFTTVSDSPTNGGTITIERMFADKAYAWHYAASSGTLVPPECHVRYIRPLDASASSWTKELTSGNLTNNLLATVAGTALDAVQGKALSDSIAALNSKLNNGMVVTHKVFPINTTPNGDITIPLGMDYAPKVLHIMSNINVYPYNAQSTYIGNIRGSLAVSYGNTNSGLPNTARCMHLQDSDGHLFVATVKSINKDNLVLTISNTSTVAYDAYAYITAY